MSKDRDLTGKIARASVWRSEEEAMEIKLPRKKETEKERP